MFKAHLLPSQPSGGMAVTDRLLIIDTVEYFDPLHPTLTTARESR